MTVLENEKRNAIFTTLTRYYSLFELSVIIIVGIFFLVFAILVKVKAPGNFSAIMFYLASMGLAMVIVMTAGNYTIGPLSYGYVNRILWLVAYSFTPVLFFHFTLSFIKAGNKKLKIVLAFLYILAASNVILLGYFFIDAAFGNNIVSLKYYVSFFHSFFRVFVVVNVIAAISTCIYAYRQAINLEERKRLQWLMLGFFIGPLSFILFWILPILLTGHSLIPEALVLIFLTAIPITFSIAIVKYQLMDINLLVKRSIVYSTILIAIILTYAGLSWAITFFVKDVNPAFPSVITAIAAVTVLQPLKTGIQKFVDKRFFRVEYNYRKEQMKFLDDIKSSLDLQTLAEKIVIQTDRLIPVDKIAFFRLTKPDNMIKLIADKGWGLLKNRSIKFEEENLKTQLSTPVAVDSRVEPGLNIEAADVKVFKRWGMVLVFPVKSPSGIIHAFIVLGAKKSGARFFKDDIDLLNTVSATAALAIDRINLQEELMLEQLEAERLEELNRIKSFFVSTVSHELKTPLTAIKMFVDLLKSKFALKDKKFNDYLNIIDGESDKLKSLIDNILDFTKIEKGMQSYELKKTSLNSIVKEAVNDLQYQIKMAKQVVEYYDNNESVIINADTEAVKRAVINLITNAIKYSNPNTTVKVMLVSEKDFVGVTVMDEGQGMDKQKMKKVFEPFYRTENDGTLTAEGTGLGLAIVKNIMDAHSGKVEIESEIGKGSTFTLWFPVMKNE